MKYARNIGQTAFFLAAFAFICCSVNGQSTIPNVLPPTVSLNNPSPILSDWQSRASTATVTVVNNSASSFPSKIWVEFILNGNRVAFSQPYKLPVTTINSGPNFFNGEQLVPLSTVHFENNVDQNSRRAGRIPDGEVCFIVHVQELDPKTKNPTGREAIGQDCKTILSYYPPSLILPGNTSMLCKLGYNNVIFKSNNQPVTMFQWTPVIPVPQTFVTYHFAIFEVLPGQAPIAAFRGARSVFERDILNLTNLIWPTEYFLPEKGKMYTWSVQALDVNRNPFVLTNDGWAEPFTFTVGSDCDVNGTSGLLILPQVLDFGSVRINSGPVTQQITFHNIGTEPLNIQLPTLTSGAASGFSLSSPPSTPVILPAASTTLNVTFNPTQIGMADGSVRIATDGGTAQVQLKGEGVDAASPTITIKSPSGGEIISAGSPFTIAFTSSDNIGLTGFEVRLSTDGGASFPVKLDDPMIGNPSTDLWNVPSDLETQQGRIKVTAKDKSGNIISGLSGLFSVTLPGTNESLGGCEDNKAFCALFVSQEIPRCALPGSSVNVTVTMKNTGTEIWNSNIALVSQNNPQTLWGPISAVSPTPVSPGSNATFNFTITAPNSSGTYNFTCQMFDLGTNTFFGQPSLQVPVKITPDCSGSGSGSGLNATDNWTFVPLALEIFTPTGEPRGIIPGPHNQTSGGTAPGSPGNTQGGISPGQQDNTSGEGKIDIPSDLIDLSNSVNSGGGIMITAPDGGDVNMGGMRYAVQYRETDFEFITSGKGTITYNDQNGNTLNATIIYPENGEFINAESFLQAPNVPGVGDGAATTSSEGKTGSSNTEIHIAPLNTGSGDLPITAYFNPKEITIDKAVSWGHHEHPGGDAPTKEFTAGEPKALDVELMFDMFEDQKSVKPDLQHLVHWLGVETGKNSRVKIRFFWDREGKKDLELSGLSMKYTMFLPDGTPTRARIVLHLKDSLHSRSEALSKNSGGTDAGGYENIFFATNSHYGLNDKGLLLPAVQHALLDDPVFSGRERDLRAMFAKNLPAIANARVKFGRDQLKGTTKTQGDFNLAHKFNVEIDGVMVGGIHSIDGIEHEHDIVEYKDGEDGTMHTRPGNHKPGKITIEKDWSSTKEFFNWRQTVINGKVDRKNISITLHNDAGQERRYNFFDCFPTQYIDPSLNAKNSGHATEKIELSYEDFDVKPSLWHFSGDLKSMKGSLSPSAQQMTMLIPATIGGEKANMILIGLLLPAVNTDPNAVNGDGHTAFTADLASWKWQAFVPHNAGVDWSNMGGGPGGSSAQGRSYISGNFALDLDGIKAGMIKKLEGGDIEADPVKGEQFGMQVMPTSGAVYEWIKASFDHTFARKSGELQAADFKRDVRNIREFKDALLTEIGFPALDASAKDPAYMMIKFKPEYTKYKKDSGKIDPSKYAIDPKIQKKWLPANFRLKIDGLEEACTRVNKIEALTIKQKVTENPVGEMRDYQKEPASLETPNLVVSFPESSSDDFYKWHEDFVITGNNGGSNHKQGSLEYLNADGDVLEHFDLYFIPQNISPPKRTPGGNVIVTLGTSPSGVAHDSRAYTGGKYGVELDGIMAGWVSSAEGGHATSDVVTEKLGPDHIARKHIGGVKYEDITLTCGTGMSKAFYQWIQDSWDHKYSRKNGAVIAANYDFKELTRLNFYNALITEIGMPALDPASKDAAKMTIKFTPETTKFQKIDTPVTLKYPSDPKTQKTWLPSNFRLKIDGLDAPCTKVNKIEAITIKQKINDNHGGQNTGGGDCSKTASAIMGSDEYRSTLIKGFYQTYLRRAADPGGLNTYLSLLKSGGKIDQILIGLLISSEYFITQAGNTNSGFVSEIYQDLLGRTADAGSSIFLNALNNSTQTRTQVVTGIMGSPEYLTREITKLYQTYLGRTPGSAETSQWMSLLQGGQSSEQLKANLMGSQEYRTKNSSKDCADLLYPQLLGRPATQAERAHNENIPPSEGHNLTIYLPSDAAAPFYKWHENFVINGKNEQGSEKSGTLDYLAEDLGTTLFTMTFHGLGIFRMTPEKPETGGDKIKRVKIEMYVEEMKFDYKGSR